MQAEIIRLLDSFLFVELMVEKYLVNLMRTFYIFFYYFKACPKEIYISKQNNRLKSFQKTNIRMNYKYFWHVQVA